MHITYELTPEDLAIYSKEHAPKNAQHYVLVGFLVCLILAFVSSDLIFSMFVSYPEGARQTTYFIARVAIMFAIIGAFYLTAMTMTKYTARKAQQDSPGANGLFCKHTITLADDGFTEETPVNRCFHTWSSVEKVAEGKNFIAIFLRLGSAYVIPKHSFSDKAQSKVFVSEIERHIESSKIPPPPAFS